MSDMNCPYCGADVDVCHDDGFGYSEDEAHHYDCYECGKNFIFFTSISFHYEPQKADCLNGSPHDFRPTFTAPVEYTKMQCRACEKRRDPTPAEMVKIVADRDA